MVLVELVVVLVVDLRSKDLELVVVDLRSKDLEVLVEGVVVLVVVVLVVVLRVVVVMEDLEVVVEVVLFFIRLRRSLQLGFSVVVGTKFHHFLMWVIWCNGECDNGKVMSHYSIYKTVRHTYKFQKLC